KIQPFNYHLRANQYICSFLFKLLYQVVVRRFSANAINIHPRYFCRWEYLAQMLFNFFRAEIPLHKTVIAASRAGGNRCVGCSAIMALQPVGEFVIGERNIAVFAMRYPPANLANLVWRIPAAVLKQYYLFSILQ